MTEKTNAKTYPQKYFVRHMHSGLAGYEGENLLVTTDTMKAMCKSFEMKPVFVLHQESVNVENVESEAAGYVTRCFYNEADAWLWAEIIVITDEGMNAIEKGWSVSNAYMPNKLGQGGECQGVPYENEVLEAEFTHLAIVPNPRYENATIMTPEKFKEYQEDKNRELMEIKNSKPKKRKKMFNVFNKVKEKTNEPDRDSYIELLNDDGTPQLNPDGTPKEKKLSEIIETVENAADDEDDKKEKKEKVNMDASVTVGGEEKTIQELVNDYLKITKNKKNEDDKKEDKKDEEKENESEKSEDDDKKEKMNDKSKSKFDDIMNARDKADFEAPATFELRDSKLEKGKKY